ncbi:hydrolase pyvD isoform X2 [Vigna angularis]|uniref:hydrolase pyvD isoform X2 n=1 Tax=Phaseolus angularis TaxID=3914 RepID=UPI00080A3F4C|nr:hydrolase pyvD isoform X2 [Vigna angularis]XP_052733204.1 hydrolase pyvD isoform X2 [Vigna angularis]
MTDAELRKSEAHNSCIPILGLGMFSVFELAFEDFAALCRNTSPLVGTVQPKGKGIEIAKPIIEALKRKGASAVGFAGFCWGARTVTNLGKTKLVQTSVLLHPSFITVDDIRGVEVPIAILGVEHDSIAPPKLLNQFKQVLDAKSKKQLGILIASCDISDGKLVTEEEKTISTSIS